VLSAGHTKRGTVIGAPRLSVSSDNPASRQRAGATVPNPHFIEELSGGRIRRQQRRAHQRRHSAIYAGQLSDLARAGESCGNALIWLLKNPLSLAPAADIQARRPTHCRQRLAPKYSKNCRTSDR
jgi:hypothetical protein